jgi:hypothetical protein
MGDSVLARVPAKYLVDFRALMQDPAFVDETDATWQMVTATHSLHHRAEKVPFSAIASFCNVSKGTIQKHWKRSRRGMLPHGRQSAIPDPIKCQMFEFIMGEFVQGRPVGYETILDWLYAEHHLAILPDTLRHLIRRTDTFKTIRGVPTEAKRCEVSVEGIVEHFQRLSQEIEDVPGHLPSMPTTRVSKSSWMRMRSRSSSQPVTGTTRSMSPWIDQ